MKLAFLVLILSGCGCSVMPTHEALRSTALRLEFSEDTLCSGTAVGPDLILTAEHCLDGALVTVNGHKVRQARVVRDKKRDVAWIRVTGMRFGRWSPMGPAAKQGEHVRWWGNPQGVADVYREGYVSLVDGGQLVIDATICKGDSGAGVFNARGEVVAVVSAMNDTNGCTFMLAWRP